MVIGKHGDWQYQCEPSPPTPAKLQPAQHRRSMSWVTQDRQPGLLIITQKGSNACWVMTEKLRRGRLELYRKECHESVLIHADCSFYINLFLVLQCPQSRPHLLFHCMIDTQLFPLYTEPPLENSDTYHDPCLFVCFSKSCQCYYNLNFFVVNSKTQDEVKNKKIVKYSRVYWGCMTP